MSGSRLIALRGLEKRFGAVSALRGVDLEVAEGQSLAILGPNGAGKSTLLRVVAGLAHPSGGEIERPDSSASRSRIGYLGHATLLYPELSARENLVFAGRLHRVADPGTRADTLLAEEDLADVADRRAGGFSRGMAQRLSIARARVHDPALLLLDEPFTGLDHAAADRLSARLGALRERGQTLVLVTHELDRAAALADAAIVLRGGRIVARLAGDDLEPDRLALRYAEATIRARSGDPS